MEFKFGLFGCDPFLPQSFATSEYVPVPMLNPDSGYLVVSPLGRRPSLQNNEGVGGVTIMSQSLTRDVWK